MKRILRLAPALVAAALLVTGCPVPASPPPAPAAVTGVNLGAGSLSLKVGATGQLAATVLPAHAGNKTVSWDSGDDAVATVADAGLVTAVAAGVTTITVTTAEGAFTAACALTVNNLAHAVYVYAANYGDNHLTGYRLNETTGALTQISGSPFAFSKTMDGLNLHPSGKFLYAGSQTDDTITLFIVNEATGAVAQSGSWASNGDLPYSVGFDPDGKFLLAGNYLSDNISVFSVDRTTGALSLTAGSPFASTSAPTCIKTIRVAY